MLRSRYTNIYRQANTSTYQRGKHRKAQKRIPAPDARALSLGLDDELCFLHIQVQVFHSFAW